MVSMLKQKPTLKKERKERTTYNIAPVFGKNQISSLVDNEGEAQIPAR